MGFRQMMPRKLIFSIWFPSFIGFIAQSAAKFMTYEDINKNPWAWTQRFSPLNLILLSNYRLAQFAAPQ